MAMAPITSPVVILGSHFFGDLQDCLWFDLAFERTTEGR